MTKAQVYEIFADELLGQSLIGCANLDENVKNYEFGLIDGIAIMAKAIAKKLEEERPNE